MSKETCTKRHINSVLSSTYVKRDLRIEMVMRGGVICSHVSNTSIVNNVLSNMPVKRDIPRMCCQMCMPKEKRHVNNVLSSMYVTRDLHIETVMQESVM